MNNNIIIQALLLCKGINRKTISKVYKQVMGIKDYDDILYIVNSSTNINNQINKDVLLSNISKAYDIYEKSKVQEIQLISIADQTYPSRLRLIDDPPAILYVRGDLHPFETGKNVAIIGTREPTSHGAKVAEHFGIQFAQRGCNVISGLAIGCDTFAHVGCLTGGGKTLAVLPGGVDHVYPASNRNLAEDILINSGALISEYKPGEKPFKSNYVERDRLQSAFSEVIVVVETDIEGGTMHTVNFTIEQNKILAAYKHPKEYINEPKIQGNIALINNGKAIPVDSVENISELVSRAEFKYKETNHLKPENENGIEQISFFDN